MNNVIDAMKASRAKLESYDAAIAERRKLHFANFADNAIGAYELLALQLAQAHYELDLARAQAADLARQFNEERALSAERYFAGVEDCRAIVSGGTIRTLDPDSRMALMDRMAALHV